MAQTGHPDWLRLPVGVDQVFINTNITLNASGITLGTFYVSDFTSLSITLFDGDATAYNWLELRWDRVMNPLVWSSRDAIAIGPLNTGVYTVPVKGTWVEIVAFADINASSPSSILVYGTSSTITPDMDRGSGDRLISDNSAYAINQQKTFDAVAGYAGPTMFSFTSSAGAPANVELKLYSTSLKLHLDYAVTGVPIYGNGAPAMLYLPPRHLRIAVNNGGTAQTIQVYITPAPLFG